MFRSSHRCWSSPRPACSGTASRRARHGQSTSPTTSMSVFANRERCWRFRRSTRSWAAVFYTLHRSPPSGRAFVRQNDNCLICHSSGHSARVPGHLVRSVYVDGTGQPILSAGSFGVDHTTPLADRWGGWYVTGTHGIADPPGQPGRSRTRC